MGAQSIKIPVELEVKQLQNSLNTLQNALDKIDPGSKIYKSVEAGLARVAKKMNSLEVESKKTFTNTSQINQFEKDFGKVGTEIQELANMLSKVSFSDLGSIFSDADLSGLRAAEGQLAQLQNNLNNVKTNKLQELAAKSTDVSEAMKNLGKNTFEGLTQEVGKKISALTSEIEKAEARLAGFESRKTKLQSDIKFLDKPIAGNPANWLKPGGEYTDKIGRWKSGKKQVFLDRLKELGYDNETLQMVEKTAGKNMQALIKRLNDKELNLQEQAQKTLRNKLTKVETDIGSIKSDTIQPKINQRSSYQNVLAQLQGIEVDPVVIGAIEDLNNKIEEQRKIITELQAELVKQSGVLQDSAKTQEQVGNATANATKETEANAKALREQAEAAQMLDNIKYAIKRWFGFNEVINLTKQSVRNMVNNIRELDDVMTQIAIVTDMTQKDLWNQMSAYSSMANQFGVTIKGVYEVSQLFYQQGHAKFNFS